MRYVEGTEIVTDGEMATAVVRLSERMEVLSSAPLNGGHAEADALFIMQVPHRHFIRDPVAELVSVRDACGLPEDAVGFMTAAEVEYVFSEAESSHGGADTFAAATAGLSNHVVAGETIDNWDERFSISMERYRMLLAGTINVIGVSPSPLTDAGKVNLMIPMVEAKSAALASLGYRETGTTSDAMAVVSPIGGDRVQFTGTGVPIGISMARSVKSVVASALAKRGDFPHMGTLADRLREAGFDEDRIWRDHMRVAPGGDRGAFAEGLAEACLDPGLSALVQGAIALDGLAAKGCICAAPRGSMEFGGADRRMGEAVAAAAGGPGAAALFRRASEALAEARGNAPFAECAVLGLACGLARRGDANNQPEG
ncbi:MAG: adenosylcobinamide amidohydrolase [Candidatus Methanoplasma sp.]|jgi:adenosylcobinamide amidohydrolase|nr:adenosylcobinamide amidohydrolase [Candidatus Methanoplasma sp.]